MRLGRPRRTQGSILAAVIGFVVVSGCGDPGFSSLVINDSDQAFLVRYTSTSVADSTSVVLVDRLGRGVGIGGMDVSAWQDAKIEVLGLDCAVVGILRLDLTKMSVRIAPDLRVERLSAVDAPTVEPTAPELKSDPRCS